MSAIDQAEDAQVLPGIAITDANLVSTTATVDTTQLWVSGTNYAIGDKRRRAETDRIYRRATAGAGATPPENDPTSWQDYAPVNEWAMFDGEQQTQTVATGVLQVVLTPGLFDSIAAFGLDGATRFDVLATNGLGGAEIFRYSTALEDSAPADYWNYFFDPFRPSSDIVVRNITPYSDARVTVTFTNEGGGAVKVGMLSLGTMLNLGKTRLEGAEPTVDFRDFSYYGQDEGGRLTIERRGSAKDISFGTEVELIDQNFVLQTMQDMLGVPAAYIGSTLPEHRGLRTWGLGTAKFVMAEQQLGYLDVTVKGNI